MRNIKERFSIKIALLVLICILGFIFAGCSKDDILNNVFKKYELETYDDVLGALVNYIETEEKDNIINLKIVNKDESISEYDEKSLIIPLYVGTKIKVEEVMYDQENNSFIPEKVIFEDISTNDYAAYFTFIRPEGIPHHMITMEYKDKKATLLIAYDGKDGNDKIEYIVLDYVDE